jgi:hypothetical protein
MSIEDTTRGGGEERCIVCEKSVAGGSGYAHLKHDNEMVTLCCPLCLETFRKKPEFYVALRASRNIMRPEQKKE